jgi:hypothetical protein
MSPSVSMKPATASLASGGRRAPWPAHERAAQHGQDAHARPVEVLQEDHLELDRVLDRVAVVLDGHRPRRASRQLVDQRQLRRRDAERRRRTACRVSPKRSGSP